MKLSPSQEIQQEYSRGLISYDEMREAIHDLQSRCHHKNSTVVSIHPVLQFCDACGKKIEDDEE